MIFRLHSSTARRFFREELLTGKSTVDLQLKSHPQDVEAQDASHRKLILHLEDFPLTNREKIQFKGSLKSRKSLEWMSRNCVRLRSKFFQSKIPEKWISFFHLRRGTHGDFLYFCACTVVHLIDIHHLTDTVFYKNL